MNHPAWIVRTLLVVVACGLAGCGGTPVEVVVQVSNTADWKDPRATATLPEHSGSLRRESLWELEVDGVRKEGSGVRLFWNDDRIEYFATYVSDERRDVLLCLDTTVPLDVTVIDQDLKELNSFPVKPGTHQTVIDWETQGG